jgi:hypothetical protein
VREIPLTSNILIEFFVAIVRPKINPRPILLDNLNIQSAEGFRKIKLYKTFGRRDINIIFKSECTILYKKT